MVNIIQEKRFIQCLIHSFVKTFIYSLILKKAKRPNGSHIFNIDERGIYLKDYMVDDELRPRGLSIALRCL